MAEWGAQKLVILIKKRSNIMKNKVSESKKRKISKKKAPAACCVKMRELKSWSFWSTKCQKSWKIMSLRVKNAKFPKKSACGMLCEDAWAPKLVILIKNRSTIIKNRVSESEKRKKSKKKRLRHAAWRCVSSKACLFHQNIRQTEDFSEENNDLFNTLRAQSAQIYFVPEIQGTIEIVLLES